MINDLQTMKPANFEKKYPIVSFYHPEKVARWKSEHMTVPKHGVELFLLKISGYGESLESENQNGQEK